MENEELNTKISVLAPDISLEQVVVSVARYYQIEQDFLFKVIKGPQSENLPRKIAMYLCQELTGAKLHEIAELFGLSSGGSVGFITHDIRKKCTVETRLAMNIEEIRKSIIGQKNLTP